MVEIWKPIIYKNVKRDMYEVSSLGRIRNVKTDHIMTPCPSEKGYMMVCLRCSGDTSKTVKIHRVVAETFLLKKKPHLDEVNHIDGDKTNNCVDNLEWTDRSGNISHGFNTGLIPCMCGELNGNSCLVEHDVHTICKLLIATNGRSSEVAKRMKASGCFEATRHRIHDIKRKRVWCRVSDKYFNKDYFTGLTQLSTKTVTIVCKVLAENNCDIGITYDILIDRGIFIPKDILSMIKDKVYWDEVSDKYF